MLRTSTHSQRSTPEIIAHYHHLRWDKDHEKHTPVSGYDNFCLRVVDRRREHLIEPKTAKIREKHTHNRGLWHAGQTQTTHYHVTAPRIAVWLCGLGD